MNSDSPNKRFAPNDSFNENSNDSMTNVHFLENAVYKYMSGDRQPISIRIDTGLYNRFKPLAKRVYGMHATVWKGMQPYKNLKNI